MHCNGAAAPPHDWLGAPAAAVAAAANNSVVIATTKNNVSVVDCCCIGIGNRIAAVYLKHHLT